MIVREMTTIARHSEENETSSGGENRPPLLERRSPRGVTRGYVERYAQSRVSPKCCFPGGGEGERVMVVVGDQDA